MEYWAVVLADTVLLVVALAGGALTLVRRRQVGGFAVGLAGGGCGVLALTAIVNMVWYTQLIPNAINNGDPYLAADLYDGAVLVTFFLFTIGVGLLVAATNVGRAAAGPEPALQPAPHPAPQNGYAPARGSVPAMPPPQQAQPAQGWTPPQQATQQAQPDWNIHSGVWSIPRGTFDGPPPDQHQR